MQELFSQSRKSVPYPNSIETTMHQEMNIIPLIVAYSLLMQNLQQEQQQTYSSEH